MRSAFVTALALLCLQASAQTQSQDVITGCIASATGSLYAVRAGTAPAYPCQKKDKPISWNMAGQPGPKGDIGPSLPPSASIDVDCGVGGQGINNALATQAERLTVNIHGTCHEAVEINRDHVTLAAADPSNPPTLTDDSAAAVTVSRARDVSLRHLNITGGGGGSGVWAGNSQVTLEFCEIWNKCSGVDMEGLSALEIRDSRIHDNACRGIDIKGGGAVTVIRSQIETNGGLAMGLTASIASVVSSTIRNNFSGIRLEAASALTMESSEVSGSYEGVAVYQGSSAKVSSSTISGNTGVGIGGANNSAVDLTDVTVSDNPDNGIALVSSASLNLYGRCVVTGNHYGVAAYISSSLVVSAETTIHGNQVGISCNSSSVGACLGVANITDSINGCGSECPNQP